MLNICKYLNINYAVLFVGLNCEGLSYLTPLNHLDTNALKAAHEYHQIIFLMFVLGNQNAP